MKFLSIFRACGNEIKKEDYRNFRPDWFSKFACFNSFHNSFKDKNIHIVWDGPENELSEHIKRHNVIFHKLDLKSNKGSSFYCYNLAEKEEYDFLWLSEDDWLYLPEAGNILQHCVERGEFANHLITLYDRPHGYRNPEDDITYGNDYIFFDGLYHWRTAESCMLTMGLTKKMFMELIKDFRHYCKIGVGGAVDREMFRDFYKMGIRLFNPIPGPATHCVNVDLAPIFGWKAISEDFEAKYKI